MHHARLRLVIATAVAATAVCVPALSLAPVSRPSFVVLLADDQGWGDLSVHGNSNLATPHIDSLAHDGVRLEHFYVSPVCSPTRAEFLTGRYHPRGGVYGTSARAERLDLDERTIAETFKAAGYATAAFGKWHNGSQGPYHPNARGFDEFYGFLTGHFGHYFDGMLDHNGVPERGKGFLADDVTDRAMAFIERNRERPFFAYVAYNTPHSPMQVPDRFYEKFARADLPLRATDRDREEVAHTRAALAMVENVDWNVGRILARLDTLGIAGNTVVLYFSDNGPNGWRWNGGFKGIKGSIDEGGIRAPFLIRWPGRIPAGVKVPQTAAAIDLLPTLADLADIPVLGDKPLDGKSIEPLLFGRPKGWMDRKLFAFRGRKEIGVRTQRFRLDGQGRLYDIEADPGQTTEVTSRHPAIAAELREDVAVMRREAMTDGEDNRPLPVGYAPRTELPAGDGVGEGGIERSNRFPNSAYFTKWTSTAGTITWDIEVVQAAEYDATVQYACPAADVGATLELAFRGSTVTAKVSAPHDPPALGAEQDRVPRQESYVKDWKGMSVGTIRLARGRGHLTLRALEIPGRQALELWSLTLTRR